MNHFYMRMAVYITACLLLCACKKKFDEYYERPDSLEPPIYQQLEARGNFKNVLAAIDKTGYKPILSAAGYWTFFAPHDSAFQVYLASKNLNSIDQLDSATCRDIVTYCLVYNGFRKERLDDYQSANGWVEAAAFKRKTANYTFVYDGVDTSGKPVKVIAANRNGLSFSDADNNNKYIPYFINGFMAGKGLGAADYRYFYPNTIYTGFNVVDAAVTEQDIAAENGVIHVVNKVITSLPSIDQYLEGKPEYSLFKSLFDQFLVQYVHNPAITRRYQLTRGSTDPVYTKYYSAPFGSLAFALNNENFLNAGNDAQTDGYSIFAPTNDVLQKYIDETLLENYPAGATLKSVPVSIVYDFVNAHLWQKSVWPSKFVTSTNYLGEEARFDPENDIVDKKILSNGFFYGTKKVQEANVFTSVYGRAYLDPHYAMMMKLLNYESKGIVSDLGRDFTLFLVSDAAFNEAGFKQDAMVSNNTFDQFKYEPPPGSGIAASQGPDTRIRLLRMLNMHVVQGKVLNDLTGDSAVLTIGGEYIGFRNGKVFASGNVDTNNVANILATKTSKNGRVYYIDRPLFYSDKNVGTTIEKIGTTANSPYNYFWQFLKGSTAFTPATKEIANVSSGSFYTLFVPTNQAVEQAVRDGYLPGDAATGAPNFNAAMHNEAQKQQVVSFIQHHFVDKQTVAADGIVENAVETLLRSTIGQPIKLTLHNQPGILRVYDMNGRSANVVSTPSTYLGNRIIIHLIDNYLQYTL